MRMRGYIKYVYTTKVETLRRDVYTLSTVLYGRVELEVCVVCLVHIASMQCCSLWPLLCSDGRMNRIGLQLTLNSSPSL